mgnify:CR=1 FL=1
MGVNEVVEVGTRIKEIRKQKGWKQKEIAERAGIPYSTYANYENNKREPPKKQLEKISCALGVSIYEILGITTEQLLQPLKDETRFLNYLLSLGYEYIDTFYTNDYGYDRCIHVINDNIDIPLTKDEYELLKLDIKEDIDKEIRMIRRYKNL